MQQKIMEPYIDQEMNLIELGVGSGFCANYLKSRGFNIETIDIDAAKKPDYLADITTWVPEKQYDALLSYQVFEHIPFSIFESIIERLSSLKIKYLFVSVPYNYMSKGTILEGRVKFPILKFRTFRINWPPFVSVPIREKHHQWELDDKHTPKEKYYDVFTKNGYKGIQKRKMHYAQYDVFELIQKK